jgi:hypothetical protein
MQKIMSRLSGKKALFLVPVIVLLAAGCGSSQSANTGSNNSPGTEQTANAPVSPVATSTNPSINATGSPWQGTLQTSDNSAKGNYMISVSGHTIYLRSSRDYSQLVGKQVNVSYSGDMTHFVLGDITAQ